MRKLLVTLLLLPLLPATARDPVQLAAPISPWPPWFRSPAGSLPQGGAPAGSVLLVPLDAAGAAVRLTSARAGVSFDMDGDGDRERVAWPEPGSELAFLVLDVDRNGRVTSGKEIFGTHAAGGVPNGYLALLDRFTAVDGPPAGSLHAGHALYEQLLLWVDRNHDGASDPGELRNARETFTAIGMGYVPLRWRDEHGNQLRFQGWTELRTGGPDQSAAVEPAGQRPRLRHSYDVVLQMQ